MRLEAGPGASRLTSERTGERAAWLPAVGAGAITAVTAVAVAASHQPGRLSFAALGGIIVLAAALVEPRVVFAGILFALAGYLPDVLLGNGTVGPALLAVTAGAVMLPRVDASRVVAGATRNVVAPGLRLRARRFERGRG